MCNAQNCSHTNLDDDISDLLGDAASFARAVLSPEKVTSIRAFETTCHACHGSGLFRGYTQRIVGRCHKCKGTGVIRTKTDPVILAASRVKAAGKRAEKSREIANDAQRWTDNNAADNAWIAAKADSFDFAAAMREALAKYGTLTEKQHATVTRLRIADAERTAARKVEAEARNANAPTINVAAIETAFAHAKGKGIKRPKMKLAGYKFSEAPATGRNAGALYVVRVEDDQYLGKIVEGKFTCVRECSEAEQAEVVAVASDPHNAAIAYGQRTGNCAICSRELTNHASIDLGIGPICAEEYGWA